MKTLIVTGSGDVTVDVLIEKLGASRVFRWNYDLWRDYRVLVGPDTLTLSSPDRISISEDEISKVYWRKPLLDGSPPTPTPSSDSQYLDREMWHIMRDVFSILAQHGKDVLVDPCGTHRAGKLVQLRTAQRHFRVPRWAVGLNGPLSSGSLSVNEGAIVVKSLSGGLMDEGRYLFTTPCSLESLDQRFPWYVQERVLAEADVTVVYAHGRVFPFELDRSWLPSPDYRRHYDDPRSNAWHPTDLSRKMMATIGNFMEDMALDFGRLDFLRKGPDLYFLEVNPNGQWAWLDLDGRFGLMEWIRDLVDPNIPIPLNSSTISSVVRGAQRH